METTQIYNKKKGIIAIILSAFCFALVNFFVAMSGDLPVMQKSVFRNIIILIFSSVYLMKTHESLRFPKKTLGYLFLRALCGTIGLICNFYACSNLMQADATMLNKMSPFFALIFAVLILKEKVSVRQALLILGAFVGSILVMKPSFANTNLIASLIGMLGGIAAGAAYTFVRKLSTMNVKGTVVIFAFSAFGTLVTLPFCIIDYVPMTTIQFIYLICSGLAAMGGQIFVTMAYFNAPVKEVSVYNYSQIIFSTLLGFIVLSQVPDVLSVIGYVIIVGMAITMLLTDPKNKKKKIVKTVSEKKE